MTQMIAIAPVRKSVLVKAPPTRAFDVFTAKMSAWWPPTHTILKSPFKEAVVEPRPGGRWYHLGEDGSTCETGLVRVWEPPHRLVLVWQLNAEWQYDKDLEAEDYAFPSLAAEAVVEALGGSPAGDKTPLKKLSIIAITG